MLILKKLQQKTRKYGFEVKVFHVCCCCSCWCCEKCCCKWGCCWCLCLCCTMEQCVHIYSIDAAGNVAANWWWCRSWCFVCRGCFFGSQSCYCTVVVDSVRQMLRLLLACALAVVSDAVYAKAAVNVAVNTLVIIADSACVVFVCCHCRWCACRCCVCCSRVLLK